MYFQRRASYSALLPHKLGLPCKANEWLTMQIYAYEFSSFFYLEKYLGFLGISSYDLSSYFCSASCEAVSRSIFFEIKILRSLFRYMRPDFELTMLYQEDTISVWLLMLTEDRNSIRSRHLLQLDQITNSTRLNFGQGMFRHTIDRNENGPLAQESLRIWWHIVQVIEK